MPPGAHNRTMHQLDAGALSCWGLGLSTGQRVVKSRQRLVGLGQILRLACRPQHPHVLDVLGIQVQTLAGALGNLRADQLGLVVSRGLEHCAVRCDRLENAPLSVPCVASCLCHPGIVLVQRSLQPPSLPGLPARGRLLRCPCRWPARVRRRFQALRRHPMSSFNHACHRGSSRAAALAAPSPYR